VLLCIAGLLTVRPVVELVAALHHPQLRMVLSTPISVNSTSMQLPDTGSSPVGWFQRNKKRCGGSTACTTIGSAWPSMTSTPCPPGSSSSSVHSANHWLIWSGSVTVRRRPPKELRSRLHAALPGHRTTPARRG
jgi:hypothetical protein